MAVALLSGCGSGSGPESASADQLDQAINQVMADKSIPGAIVGVWGPDGQYVRAFGVADKASQAPMQTDMFTRIGSVTKTFTITALQMLIDQGKLSLDDPIAKFIPGVPSGDVITLRLLAQMQSGLVTYDGVPEFEAAFIADPQRTFTPQQLLDYALDKPLQFPPGTQYDYCSEDMRRERFSSALPMSETARYGVGAFETSGWIGHSGVTPGYETVVVGYPEEQTALVIFANTDAPHDVGTDLARAVTEIITPEHVYR